MNNKLFFRLFFRIQYNRLNLILKIFKHKKPNLINNLDYNLILKIQSNNLNDNNIYKMKSILSFNKKLRIINRKINNYKILINNYKNK